MYSRFDSLLLADHEVALIDSVDGSIGGNPLLFPDEMRNRRIPIQVGDDLVGDLAGGDLCQTSGSWPGYACRLRRPY